jgi:hypothetical protein
MGNMMMMMLDRVVTGTLPQLGVRLEDRPDGKHLSISVVCQHPLCARSHVAQLHSWLCFCWCEASSNCFVLLASCDVCVTHAATAGLVG